jgi:hypothetical protein
MWKKWTKIEDCPKGITLLAILKNGWRFKLKWVYVHVDACFPFWTQLRSLKGMSIGSWKCIYYYES